MARRYGHYCSHPYNRVLFYRYSDQGTKIVFSHDCGVTLLKEDFDKFLWTIVFLAMGGIALGKAVQSSGLLDELDVVIRGVVSGLSLSVVVLVLSVIVLVRLPDAPFVAKNSLGDLDLY